MLASWRERAKALKRNLYALSLAARDPRVPLAAKVVVGLVVAYALSPVDLIPDFVPVLGYVDDLLLLPLGIWLAIALVPRPVWEECRAAAAARPARLPRSRWAAAMIVGIWLLVVGGGVLWLMGLVGG
ncbi:DUF1232 domain-containing protein [Litorilinea aerophila]|uniref:DUF1232 domain-containing protein n=1 Tax=Litorilinea aerophila TaxID=1204385 RepID=A0A540VA96_9CHLR|nr:DUF1232 domain-containing protein [Litorilinea aerophila]MCC9078449.1 DUF1232 domain-containing protein [Litorilinea aerophila]OUC09671.1 hypothetical protein RY27_01445 [Litorilinea aerophila]